MSSESDLIRRSLAGDVDAFRLLVEPHQDFIYGIALSVLRRPEAAEEAAQDALVRIHQGLDSFRGDVAFRSWAYRIAIRVSLNTHRRGGASPAGGGDRRAAASEATRGGDIELPPRVEPRRDLGGAGDSRRNGEVAAFPGACADSQGSKAARDT